MTIIVAANGYQPVTTTVKIKSGGTVTTDFTLKKSNPTYRTKGGPAPGGAGPPACASQVCACSPRWRLQCAG